MRRLRTGPHALSGGAPRVMPVEGEVRKAGRVSIPGTADVSVSLARGIGREVVILQSGSRAALEGAFSRFTSALAEVLGVADEPMMNIICFRAPGQYTMLLFPRAKHRPGRILSERGGLPFGQSGRRRGGRHHRNAPGKGLRPHGCISRRRYIPGGIAGQKDRRAGYRIDG